MNRHIAGIQRREYVACNKSGVYPVNKHRHAVCKFIMQCIAVSIFEKKEIYRYVMLLISTKLIVGEEFSIAFVRLSLFKHL